MQKLIDKAKIEHTLSKSEIIAILKDNSINDYLFKTADEIRKNYTGDEVYLRALIEFSNICRCDCKYCGIRRDNKNVSRYRLEKDEILKLADFAVQSGYKTIVLQSGEDMFFSAEYLAEIIKEIKQNDVAVTLSIGERTFEEYKILKDAGADRFLLRIETTDENLYGQMHPQMSLANRKQCLFNLKKLGYETGTGSLVGLPGQTLESLADDILFYKELDADMIGIGPLIVHPETPLKDEKNGDLILAIKVLALTRLLLPDINIPATTAMETLHREGRIWALKAGANVIMPNVTFENCKKNYEIYPNKVSVDYESLKTDLAKIGRTISSKKGFRGNPDNSGRFNSSPAGRGKLTRCKNTEKEYDSFGS